MKTLKQLREEKATLQRKLVDLRDLISDIETDRELPKLRKKYVGKFFKFRNGYGGDDQWYMYLQIKNVNNTRRVEAYTFEVDSENTISIAPTAEHTFDICQKEITSEEFYREYDKTMALIQYQFRQRSRLGVDGNASQNT